MSTTDARTCSDSFFATVFGVVAFFVALAAFIITIFNTQPVVIRETWEVRESNGVGSSRLVARQVFR